MVAVLWSLLGAASYGISDFIGAIAARKSSAWAVAFITTVSAALGTTALALTRDGSPTAAHFGWAALAGVGSGLGVAFLYRGLASGRIGVVAPISAVCAAALPVIVSTLTGEEPSALAWVGMAVALPGIWMVSVEPGASFGGPGVKDGVIAGLGFGLSFWGLGHVPESAGWWPLVIMNLASAGAIVLVALALRQQLVTRTPSAYLGVLGGLLSGTALVAFVLATSRGLVSISSVLISLYPAVTILLAVTLLHERVHRIQQVGLALCAGAVALVALGG